MTNGGTQLASALRSTTRSGSKLATSATQTTRQKTCRQIRSPHKNARLSPTQKETSGDTEKLLLSLLNDDRTEGQTLATAQADAEVERLTSALVGAGTNEDVLIDVAGKYSKEDLALNNQRCQEANDESLIDAVRGDTRSTFEDALVVALS